MIDAQLSKNRPMTSDDQPSLISSSSNILQASGGCQKVQPLNSALECLKKVLEKEISNRSIAKREVHAEAFDCATSEQSSSTIEYKTYVIMAPLTEQDFMKSFKSFLCSYEKITLSEQGQIVLMYMKNKVYQTLPNQIETNHQQKFHSNILEQSKFKEEQLQLCEQNETEVKPNSKQQSSEIVDTAKNITGQNMEIVSTFNDQINEKCEVINFSGNSVVDEPSQLSQNEEQMSFIKYHELDSAFIQQPITYSKLNNDDSDSEPQLTTKTNQIIKNYTVDKWGQFKKTNKKENANKDTGRWKFKQKVIHTEKQQPKTKSESHSIQMKLDDIKNSGAQTRPEWQQYLMRLSYAQSEATYLAQQMNWSIKFHEGISMIAMNMYSCTAQMVVVSNYVLKKFIGVCEGAKSKKDARHQASLLCLADIYSSVDKVFQQFKQLKYENVALCQPMKADNTQIMDRWLNNKRISDIEIIRLDREQDRVISRHDIDKYVSSLDSCKKQLYFFVAQNNKVFMMPKWKIRRPNILGCWDVEGWVKYEINNLIYEYRYKNGGYSKKEGQQKVSQAILKQIYKDFPYLFKKYKRIKQERGF